MQMASLVFVNKDASNLKDRKASKEVNSHIQLQAAKKRRQEREFERRKSENAQGIPINASGTEGLLSSPSTPGTNTLKVAWKIDNRKKKTSILRVVGTNNEDVEVASSSVASIVRPGLGARFISDPGPSRPASLMPLINHGNSDPFASSALPESISPSVALLLDVVLNDLMPSMYRPVKRHSKENLPHQVASNTNIQESTSTVATSTDLAQNYNYAANYIHASLASSTQLNALLACASAYVHRLDPKLRDPRTFSYGMKCVAGLQRRIEEGRIDFGTGQIVMLLVMAELYGQNFGGARMHLRALKEGFVDPIGGLGSPLMTIEHRESVLLVDIKFAIETAARPIFPTQGWHPGNLAQLRPELDTKLADWGGYAKS